MEGKPASSSTSLSIKLPVRQGCQDLGDTTMVTSQNLGVLVFSAAESLAIGFPGVHGDGRGGGR